MLSNNQVQKKKKDKNQLIKICIQNLNNNKKY